MIKTQLQSPQTIESALWKLGFSGTVEAGDLCAEYLFHQAGVAVDRSMGAFELLTRVRLELRENTELESLAAAPDFDIADPAG